MVPLLSDLMMIFGSTQIQTAALIIYYTSGRSFLTPIQKNYQKREDCPQA